jgi:hypothetical protein
MVLGINSGYFLKQHQLSGLCNGDTMWSYLSVRYKVNV